MQLYLIEVIILHRSPSTKAHLTPLQPKNTLRSRSPSPYRAAPFKIATAPLPARKLPKLSPNSKPAAVVAEAKEIDPFAPKQPYNTKFILNKIAVARQHLEARDFKSFEIVENEARKEITKLRVSNHLETAPPEILHALFQNRRLVVKQLPEYKKFLEEQAKQTAPLQPSVSPKA